MIKKSFKKNLALLVTVAMGATLTFPNIGVSAFEERPDRHSVIGDIDKYATGTPEGTGTPKDKDRIEGTGTPKDKDEDRIEGTGTPKDEDKDKDKDKDKDESTTTPSGKEDSVFLKVKKDVEITLDKQIVKPGEVVSITIKAKNKDCQFGSTINLTYKNGNTEVQAILKTDENGVSVGELTLPSDAKNGVYSISKMVINSEEGILYDSSEKSNGKNLLPKGSILVKTNENEKIKPVIENEDKEIKEGEEIDIDVDQGDAEIDTVDGQKNDGKQIGKLGKHEVEIVATGIDGTKTKKKVVIDVTGEITNATTADEVVGKIKDSTAKEIKISVKKDVKKVDKSIFKEIKGKDKSVTLKQENGAEWTFNGTNIVDDNAIQDIDLTVSTEDTQNSGVKDKIKKIKEDAQLIHFDYHGLLPGKAQVKVNVGSDNALKGKKLTLYYYNSETGKAEKVQDGVQIDEEGNTTIEIEHCSDYFLSEDPNLAAVGSGEQTQGTAESGDYSKIAVLFGMILIAGASLVLNRRKAAK